jgi:hypothetical protein
MDAQRNSTTIYADKRKDRSKAFGGVTPKDTIKSKPSFLQIQLDDKEGSQELILYTTSEENKVQESIQMDGDTPVAFRTRRCRQQTDSTKIEGYEEDLGQDTNRNKDKELIRRLNAKIKEQQKMIDEQSTAVTEFLQILTTVKKLQGNLVYISKRVTNTQQFKVTVPVEGHMVKPFKPKNTSACSPPNTCRVSNVESAIAVHQIRWFA